MANRIIALIDLDDGSSILVSSVFKLSRALNASVVFVHKLIGIKPAMANQDVRYELSKMEKKEAWEKLNSFIKPYPFKDALFKIGRFDFPSALNQLKDEQQTDFVFVGIKESGLLRKIFLSPTILTIINDTDFNVFGIPLTRESEIPRTLVFLCSPESPFKKGRLELIISSMEGMVVNINLVPINSDETDKMYVKEVESELIGYNLSARISAISENFYSVGEKFATETDTYFVIQQESRALKNNIFQKTLIHDIVYSGSSPLIVVSS